MGLRYHGVLSWQIVLCFLLQSQVHYPQCFSFPWSSQHQSSAVTLGVCASVLGLEKEGLLSELDANSGQGLEAEVGFYGE